MAGVEIIVGIEEDVACAGAGAVVDEEAVAVAVVEVEVEARRDYQRQRNSGAPFFDVPNTCFYIARQAPQERGLRYLDGCRGSTCYRQVAQC